MPIGMGRGRGGGGGSTSANGGSREPRTGESELKEGGREEGPRGGGGLSNPVPMLKRSSGPNVPSAPVDSFKSRCRGVALTK